MKIYALLSIALFASISVFSQSDTLKLFNITANIYFEDETTGSSDSTALDKAVRVTGLFTYEDNQLSDTVLAMQLIKGTINEGRKFNKLYVTRSVNPKLTWDQREFVLVPQQLMDGSLQNFKRNYDRWSQGRYAIDDELGVQLYMSEQRIKGHRAKVIGIFLFPLAPFCGIAYLASKHKEHQALRVLNFIQSK